MYVTNITNVYDNITSNNYTDFLNDYDNITFNIYDNCKDTENNIAKIIQALLFKIPCGLSFLCLLSLMVYTLVRPLFNIKWWKSFYTQLIQLDVSQPDPANAAKQYS